MANFADLLSGLALVTATAEEGREMSLCMEDWA
jgi:hypothetical protein